MHIRDRQSTPCSEKQQQPAVILLSSHNRLGVSGPVLSEETVDLPHRVGKNEADKGALDHAGMVRHIIRYITLPFLFNGLLVQVPVHQ